MIAMAEKMVKGGHSLNFTKRKIIPVTVIQKHLYSSNAAV